MNRIFKIAGDFLESVDQRADRSVNYTSQTPVYKTRVVENRSQSTAASSVSSRARERYSTKNNRNRSSTGTQRRPMSPGARSVSNYIDETKKTDLEVTAVLNSLNTEDSSHKRSVSEQFPKISEIPKHPERNASVSELSPSTVERDVQSAKMEEEEKPEEVHTWGEDENEVGLHITESVDPTITLSPSHLPVTTLEEAVLNIDSLESNDVISLQNHIEDLEHDLDEALSQLDENSHVLEDKNMRIDILENRIKQMRIDNDRAKEKADLLIDEKDGAIMKLQTEVENLKADYYRLKLECNEEKDKSQKEAQKSERETHVIQNQLTQLEEMNNKLKNQLLELSENFRIEEEKAHAAIREKDSKINELTANLAASQKQVEDYIMRFDNHENRGEEYGEKIVFLEKELMKVRLEKEKSTKELMNTVEMNQKRIDELSGKLKTTEEELKEKTKQISQYQKQEEIVKMNKESSYSLLQSQIEQLQQTVLKKQLLLDAVNSEKSSLEYRLADALRDKAKSESLRRLGTQQRDEWCDLERGEVEEKTHPRSIARILPDSTPEFLLNKVDQVDEMSLSVAEFLLRSPSFRLLFILYLLCVHIAVIILFFKKRCYVC